MLFRLAALDILTLIAYAALNIDVVLQIRRIHLTRSVADLSLIGLTVRLVALATIWARFVVSRQSVFIAGQGLVLLVFSYYYVIAMHYRRK